MIVWAAYPPSKMNGRKVCPAYCLRPHFIKRLVRLPNTRQKKPSKINDFPVHRSAPLWLEMVRTRRAGQLALRALTRVSQT